MEPEKTEESTTCAIKIPVPDINEHCNGTCDTSELDTISTGVTPSRSVRKKGHIVMDNSITESLQNIVNSSSETPAAVGAEAKKERPEKRETSFTINIPDSSHEEGRSITVNIVDTGSEADYSRQSSRRGSYDSDGKSGLRLNVYEKNPRYGRSNMRKISAFSQDSDQSSRPPSVVPSRKGSTVLINEQPRIINPSFDYWQEPDTASYGVPENYRMSQRMSVFSIYSHGSRPSIQGDWDFRDPYEVVPHADHYKNVLSALGKFKQRPTLQQLREEQVTDIGDDLSDNDEDGESKREKKATEKKVRPTAKLGWIQGVLVRCLLNILGVMLFLRLTWITGQAGIGLATVIILLSSCVTSVTAMSMAAICTNGEVKGGGAYYMISRSLGPEFGGAIGVVFSIANAVAAAMYVVGFAETVRDLMWEHGAIITGDPLHEVRIIGIATSFLILGIVLMGLDFESKAQLVLLVILVAAIVDFFVGTFLPPSPEKQAKGFVGYSGELFLENFGPDFRGTGFFQVFAIFFPATTGIQAGANISGDLKDPSSAIPRGTFLAIFLTTGIYLGMVWASGSCMLRDALGLTLLDRNMTNMTGPVLLSASEISQCGNVTCPYGLHNDNGAVGISAAFKPLILAGIFSATLSSALASIVSAPKVFQALGKDKLFPYIGFFAKEYGSTGEPKRGYFLTFAICVAVTCIGALDIIAPIISNFFLMAYALINFSCFDASFANSPGFRPGYKLYNKWISLLGALLCLAVMFLINWWAALVTFVVITALYIFVKHKKPGVNWGSSTQAHAYKDALLSTLKLADTEEHVKNFRPQILVLSGYPRNRPALVDFVSTITQKQSLLVSAHVMLGDLSMHARNLRSTSAYTWFRNRNIRAFYTNIAAPNLRIGVQTLLRTTGVGKLCPNTLILGFKNDWEVDDPRVVFNYFGILHDAFDLRYGVGILRVAEGFDMHKVTDDLLAVSDDEESLDDHSQHSDDEDISGDQYDVENETTDKNEPDEEEDDDNTSNADKDEEETNSVTQDRDGDLNNTVQDKEPPGSGGEVNQGYESESQSLKEEMTGHDRTVRQLTKGMSVDDERLGNRFRRKQSGTIDVWWLFDDGGLTLLLPYILSTRKQWKGCKLRVFCAGTKKDSLERDRHNMETLLKKFRIQYSQITVIPDLKKKPKRATYKEFETMLYRWRLHPGETQEELPWKVTNADLRAQKQKTYMKLRLRELLIEHSGRAALIVMTLPLLRITSCPAGLYMSWLEMLTKNLPPTLLLRGNQESVLTYFS